VFLIHIYSQLELIYFAKPQSQFINSIQQVNALLAEFKLFPANPLPNDTVLVLGVK